MGKRAALALSSPIAIAALAVVVLVGGGSANGAGCSIKTVSHKPSYFVGFGGGDSFSKGDTDARRCVMSDQVSSGIGFLRHTFDWASIERTPGTYDLSDYDTWVAEAARHKLNIIPILFDPPEFRSSRPAGSTKRGTYPPASNKAFGKFAAALVRRYGPKGTLWEDTSIPKRPIRTWQIWNEPNLTVYWLPKPNAKAFTNMVGAVRKAMKKAPGGKGIEVVSGGIPDSESSRPNVFKYLAQMYKAGARNKMDALGFHPYAPTAKGTIDKLGKVRKIMAKHGDKNGKIWVTEVGWATSGPKSPFNLGMKRTAREIKKLVPGLWKARKRLKLRGFQYYTWQDKPPYAGLARHWGYHAGLLTKSGKKKPTFAVFKRAVRGL